MSKITKALEKAARERLRQKADQATITAKATVIPVVSSGLEEVVSSGKLCIDPHIVSAADPTSPIAEQYRILRTNLQSMKRLQGAKILLVTSAIHEEGKSVTAVNLALTLAQQEGARVLLIDGDLRRSTINRWLGLEATKGLSTVLMNGMELDGALVRLGSPPLCVLPAGPHPKQPAELLDSSQMKRLLAVLKQQFDVIVIDTPPLLPVADPSILGAQADGVLLVVRAGKTQRKVVLQAKELLKQTKVRLLGCILTCVEYYIPGYYRYYHYRYGAKDRQAKSAPTRDRSLAPEQEAPSIPIDG